MKPSMPGTSLRDATVFFTRKFAAASQGSEVVSSRSAIKGAVHLVAFGVVSGAALTLSMPSVLRTMGLGLPASIPDILLMTLGLAVAAGAASGRSIGSLSLRIIYAGALVFAAPFLIVRVLA